MRRHVLIGSFIALTLFTSGAYAWAFLLAGAEWLAGSVAASRVAFATNAGLRAASAKSLTLHGTIGGLLFTSSQVIDDNASSSKTPAHVMIDLNQGGTRLNPDPTRYNDATAQSVDPTPKVSYSPYAELTVLPGSWPDVISDMGAPAFKLFRDANTTKLTKVQTVSYQVGYRPGATSQSTGGIPTTDSSGWSRQYNKKITTTSCGGSAESSPNCEYHVAYSPPAETINCPNGYTRSNNVCTLQNPEIVLKPEKTIPCEVTRDSSGAFQIDWKNPECNNLKTDGTIKTISGDTVEMSNESEAVTAKCTVMDCDISYQDKEANSWTNIKTGAPDAAGQRPITSIEYGTGTNPGFPGTGDGDGNGDGSSEGGTGCGAVGEPCNINDSGFKDLPTTANDTSGKIEQDKQDWLDRINAVSGENKHGIDLEFIPVIPRGTCKPYAFGLDQHVINIDLCEKMSILKSVLSWLLYIFTAYFIVNLFFDRTANQDRK